MLRPILRSLFSLGLLVAVVTTGWDTTPKPGGSPAEASLSGVIVVRNGVCYRASNPYCETCSCTPDRNGTGSECWIDTDQTGPSGEPCVYCVALGGCSPTQFG